MFVFGYDQRPGLQGEQDQVRVKNLLLQGLQLQSNHKLGRSDLQAPHIPPFRVGLLYLRLLRVVRYSRRFD